MANVRTIARAAGVSITTVSRVLNNHPRVSPAVRERVLSISARANYAPAVGRRITSNIALAYTGEPGIGEQFDAAIMLGMSRAMHEHGNDLIVLELGRSRLPNETFRQLFARKGCRGVILRTTAETRGAAEAIAREKFPAVVVADRFDDPDVSFVYSDSRDSSRDAVEHLIGLGHRRIAVCVNLISDSDHADRLTGYRKALAAHDLQFDPRLLLRVPANREGGAQLLRRLRTMPSRPTAVFLTDPMVAVGLMSEARRSAVRIPEDLSVVGFDDEQLRYTLTPELTAVCQDAIALGRESLAALYGLIDTAEEEKPLVPVRKALPTWLEVHASTAPPPPESRSP